MSPQFRDIHGRFSTKLARFSWLFSLPPGVRQRIYKWCFQGSLITLQRAPLSVSGSNISSIKYGNSTLAILSTCRQVYQEARQEVLKYTVCKPYKWKHHASLQSPSPYIYSTFHPEVLPKLRHIAIDIIAIGTLAYCGKESRILKSFCPNLKIVTVSCPSLTTLLVPENIRWADFMRRKTAGTATSIQASFSKIPSTIGQSEETKYMTAITVASCCRTPQDTRYAWMVNDFIEYNKKQLTDGSLKLYFEQVLPSKKKVLRVRIIDHTTAEAEMVADVGRRTDATIGRCALRDMGDRH